MVCHETYKDESNHWLSPEDVTSEDGKNFFLKNKPQQKVLVGPSESMSKSKRNTIDPEIMISLYGADAVRLFILSDSPPEKDIQWSENGMTSAHKFIQKFWILVNQVSKINENPSKENSEEIDIFTNQSIEKINNALEKFRYNIIIAVFHEIYTFYKKIVERNKNYLNLKENFIKILTVMMPVIPHIISESLGIFKKKSNLEWPKVNKTYLETDQKEVVIQVNGKKRSSIMIEKDSSEDIVIKTIKRNKLIDKYIDGKKIFKTIYVKNRIINLIVK